MIANFLAPGPPRFVSSGLVNGANFQDRIAPGAMVSLFGTSFAPTVAGAATLPLPTTLNAVSIRVNGVPAPIFFVSPGQINFQMPWIPGGPASLTVSAAGHTSETATINLSAHSPAIFSVNSQGTGQGAITVATTGEFAAPVGSIPQRPARPVRPGESISIFCTGLGEVANRPEPGAASPSNPAATTIANVTVTIGGIPAPVSFSGLAPGFVGLYQVNAEVPVNVPTGAAVPVVLTIGGVESNTTTIAAQ
jgi:uncharacterized protein (TIGR03437 family)